MSGCSETASSFEVCRRTFGETTFCLLSGDTEREPEKWWCRRGDWLEAPKRNARDLSCRKCDCGLGSVETA